MRATAEITTRSDEIEFSEAIDGYRRELHAHCMRMTSRAADSEDLVQETLVRAWRGRGGYEGRAGQASLRSWLYQIATNVCRDALRRGQKRPQIARAPDSSEGDDRVADWLDRFESPEPGPVEAIVTRERFELAMEAALALPPRQRAVLILCDVIGLSARESASLLDTTVPSVTSALQRARRGLRDRLPEERPEWA